MTEHTPTTTPRLPAIAHALTGIAADLSRDGNEAEQDVADVLELLAHAIRTGATSELLELIAPWGIAQLEARLEAGAPWARIDDQAREDAIAGLRLPDAYSGIGG